MTSTATMKKVPPETGKPRAESLRAQAKALALHGLVARWDELGEESWIEKLVAIESEERQRRSLERRIHSARIGRFKPIEDFDWGWPTKIDRELVEEILGLRFLEEKGNVILVGTSGLGKTNIAQNIAYQALLKGHTVRFATASEILNELAQQESAAGLARKLRRYVNPSLLVIDEIGYLVHTGRHADLLFEIVNRRHQSKSTIVTTNKIFQDWNQVFPHSSCVVALIDRLVHRADIVNIEGESYRLKEAKERTEGKKTKRKSATRAKEGGER
jgi:DNA replication protein DnaC